ncbi:hypothetical protein E4T43_00365 [Aureobasidium subglaciale]|nr:hypothetical protein E4T43_00365 [Aureobasidium subglaciale]
MSSCRRAQSFSKAESLQRKPSKRCTFIVPCFESATSVTYISYGRRKVSENTASNRSLMSKTLTMKIQGISCYHSF